MRCWRDNRGIPGYKRGRKTPEELITSQLDGARYNVSLAFGLLVFLVASWLFSAMGTFAWGYPYLRVCPWSWMGWCIGAEQSGDYLQGIPS